LKPLDFTLEETKDPLDTLDALEDAEAVAQRDELVGRLEMYYEAAQARVAGVREQLAIAEGFAGDLRSEITRQKRPAAPSRPRPASG
jgi:hypothetical protein